MKAAAAPHTGLPFVPPPLPDELLGSWLVAADAGMIHFSPMCRRPTDPRQELQVLACHLESRQAAGHRLLGTVGQVGVGANIYTIYAPPNHRDGVVHHTPADADADTEHFDGKTSK
jgi:hypothetical protein